MGLETGTYLDDLVVTNPVGTTDPKSQGDDHLRLIKSVLKGTFPGLVGSAFRLQTKSSDYALATADNMSVLLCTGTLVITLPDADSIGNKQMTVVIAKGASVTFTPTGADTINGLSSLTLSFNQAAIVFCDGDSEYQVVLLGGSSSNFTTGDIKYSIRTEANTEPGWIIAAGTIGDASSGATTRANADCEALFLMHWNGLANAQAAVSGGRGASAAADWAAHKTIAVMNLRGNVAAGKSDMGGSDAGNLPGGATLGALVGAYYDQAYTNVGGGTGGSLGVYTTSYSMDGSSVDSTGGNAQPVAAAGHMHANALSSGYTTGSLSVAAAGWSNVFSIVQATAVMNAFIKL